MKLTIAGIFYSGYKDLWHDFVKLFNKHWPDCSFDLVIVSDTEGEKEFDGVKMINAGKDAEYSRKVQTLIKEVPSDYYLLLLEDFFLSEHIDNEFINNALEFMKSKDLYYYAMPLDEFSVNFKGKYISKKEHIREISSKAEHTVSCQPAIWERNFLNKCIGKDNYNAWIFEGIYKESKDAHKAEFLKHCAVNVCNPLHLKHGALQSKMVPDTVEYYQKHDYSFVSQREVLSKKEYGKMKRKIRLQKVMPYWMQKSVRKMLGRKSLTDKYIDTIRELMKNMELE